MRAVGSASGCRRRAAAGSARAGAVVAVVLFLGACGTSRPQRPPPRPAPVPDAPRTLVVMLDAVPFESVAELPLAADGERPFAELSEPVPLISSFPSATTVALTGMFEPIGIERSPGYEARYFDRQRGKVVGGGPLSYQQIPFSWREFFDWKVRSLLRKAWGYVRPRKFSRWEVRSGIEAFLESQEPYYFVYVGATDGVAHLEGPDGFASVFLELDRALDAARAEESFRTVLLSDHGVGGGELLDNVSRRVRRALNDAGLDPSKRLRDRRDVVLVPFGLLSGFVVITAPGREPEVARIVASVEGVDVCTTATRPGPEADEAWLVTSAGGAATISRREREGTVEWRYEVASASDVDTQAAAGDPARLRVADSAAVSKTVSKTEPRADPLGYRDLAGVWRSDFEWYREIADRRLPDALHRIDRGFELVTNPASLLCSVSEGFMYGSITTDLTSRISVGRLRYTHGGLARDDSLGFFMTDHPGLRQRGPAPSGAVRFDRALVGIGGAGPALSPSDPMR
ncbi:MAG TPA: hypothetical protein VMT85_05185 [Thermoanaerobaculia bacterium]|nr:hypothetical protein [Thermoanaerobaculia bacterium]